MIYFPDDLTPAQFLQTVFSGIPEGFIEVTYLAPDGVKLYPRTIVQWADAPLGDINPDLPEIHKLNQRGYSCYFAPVVRSRKYEPEQRISEKTGRAYMHYERGKAADAHYTRVLWADIDEPGEDGYQRAINSLIPPSIVVSSGGGFHAYWLLTQALEITDDNREMVKRTLKGIAIHHKSDTKVAEFARIMRLPGTVNTKPNRGGALCEVIDFLPAQYSYMDMELAYAPLVRPAVYEPTRSFPMVSDKHMPAWCERYLATGEAEGNRNNRLYVVTRALLDNGFTISEIEMSVKSRALADGLTQEAVDKTFNSAVRAERGNPSGDTMRLRAGAADRRLGVMP